MDVEQLQNIQETLIPYLTKYGLNVVGALAILFAGWLLARWLSRRVQKLTERTERIDATLSPILVKGTKLLVLAITILAVLNQFGIETASIIAVLGTIGLAIGLALQGTLSNIASGFMLLLLRPFGVGDVVDIGGRLGIVDEIGLFVTEMHTFDNISITMPNSRIWGDKIENYTKNPTRRIDMIFGIGYDDDMDKAISLVKEVLAADERVLSDPEPMVAIGNLGDSSVDIFVRPWVATENFLDAKVDLNKRIKERFDEEDITIPYPQRDVHLFEQKNLS